jgi:23S rRNA G2445 N2-methylase RlmL
MADDEIKKIALEDQRVKEIIGSKSIKKVIEENIYFADISKEHVKKTENNLSNLSKDKISKFNSIIDDFCSHNFSEKFDFIITNPPFSLAYEFIQKAKQIATHKFAFLLPLSYLHGKTRFDEIWSDRNFPLSRIYVFVRYPMLGNKLRIDGKYKTGMMVYAWYVWDKNTINKEPIIKWIDNHKYVIGARNAK